MCPRSLQRTSLAAPHFLLLILSHCYQVASSDRNVEKLLTISHGSKKIIKGGHTGSMVLFHRRDVGGEETMLERKGTRSPEGNVPASSCASDDGS